MTFVVVGSILTACLLLLQGIHIMRKGNMRPFFEQSREMLPSRADLRASARIAGASLYAVPSLGIFCVLILALSKNDPHQIFNWLSGHSMALFGGLFLLTYGLVALLRPDVVIKWVGSAFPDYDIGSRKPSVERFVRGLGLFVLAFGLFILKGL